MQVISVPISSVCFDNQNARKHEERSISSISSSLLQFGQQKPIVIDGDNKVLAGNGTLQAAIGLHWTNIWAVKTELRGALAVAFAIADNRTAELSSWEEDVLWSQLDSLSDANEELFLSTGFTETEMERLQPEDEELGLPVEAENKKEPSVVYPSEPEWGIPILKLDMQATSVVLPVRVWGSVARSRKMNGTWVFYTDDYRFTGLLENPSQLIGTGALVSGEMNFSICPDTPKVCALYSVYRKRQMSRFWQEKGVKIIVDLFSTTSVIGDLDLLGVPEGWGAYSTRSSSINPISSIEFAYERASKHCGADPHLFLVYGGDKTVQRLCSLRGWIWVNEYMDK